MQVLSFSRGQHPVDATVHLLLAQRREESKCLFLAGELQQVWASPHDCCTTSGHFKDLFLLAFPSQDVELFGLGLAQEATSAAAKDWAGSVGVQCWRAPRGRLSLRGFGLGANDEDAANRVAASNVEEKKTLTLALVRATFLMRCPTNSRQETVREDFLIGTMTKGARRASLCLQCVLLIH